jgi:transcriptional regulator with XRE-family HTH domain
MMTNEELTDLRVMISAGRAKFLRRCTGKSIKQVAKELGFGVSSLVRYESGAMPSPEMREKYYRYLTGLRDTLGEVTVAPGMVIATDDERERLQAAYAALDAIGSRAQWNKSVRQAQNWLGQVLRLTDGQGMREGKSR